MYFRTNSGCFWIASLIGIKIIPFSAKVSLKVVVTETLSTTTSIATPVKRFCSSTEIPSRSEEHTSELQSRGHLVCRLLLEKKQKNRSLFAVDQPSGDRNDGEDAGQQVFVYGREVERGADVTRDVERVDVVESRDV